MDFCSFFLIKKGFIEKLSILLGFEKKIAFSKLAWFWV